MDLWRYGNCSRSHLVSILLIVLTLTLQAWLCDIEKNMQMTLKEELKKCRANLKRMLSKRDKWIKEHPGQVC